MTTKKVIINNGYQPVNEGYQPRPLNDGYQPRAADQPSGTSGVRGGYQPSSAGDNPANKPLPPSDD